MDIVNILTQETAHLMLLEAADQRKLQVAISEVKTKGILTNAEVRAFAECGFPIISILANVLKEDPQGVIAHIRKGEVTYSDFCSVIAIFAQDIKFRSQRR